MIAIFRDRCEIIVVGLNEDGNPIDFRLFGPDSGRDINNFERFDIDSDNGQSVHITNNVRVYHPSGGIILEG